jgi:chromosome segregation ATPase
LVDSVEQHDKKQSDQLQETHTEFVAKSKQQTAELETTKKDLSAAVDQQSADFSQRLEQAQKEIRKQIDALDSDFRGRLQSYKEESHKRDDDLRQEFIALGAWLDDKKASRHDLGQMLVQIGQRLGQDKESLLDDPENEPAK